MNSNIKTIFTIIGIFAISGAVGATTYFVIKKSDHTSVYVKPSYSEKLEGMETTVEEIGDYLGTNGMDRLKARIMTELPYGPEIFMLKKIVLGDSNITQPNENGVYYGSTSEIYINTDNMAKTIPKEISGDLRAIYPSLREEEYMDAKIEIVFQTLFHEYLHHFSYVYNNSVKGSSSDGINTWVANNDVQVSESWNKNFLNEFKNALQYNSSYLTNESSLINKNGLVITPISNLYSLKDLWDKANNKWTSGPNVYKELVSINNNYGFIHSKESSSSKVITPFNENIISKSADGNDLPYLYSASELFSRKYMQALYKFTIPSPIPFGQESYNNFRVGLDTRGTIFEINQRSMSFHYSSFLLDTLRYQDGLSPRNGFSIPRRFYDDAPFAISGASTGTTQSMYDLISKQSGYDNGSDISLIWSKNDSELESANSYKPIGDSSLIKFGGYVADNRWNKIGYFEDEKNQTNFVSFPIISDNKYNIKYKEKLLAQSVQPLDSTKENNFYVTKDWIPYSEILNKNLYFATEVNTNGSINYTNIDPLKSLRNSNSLVSTYYNQLNAKLYNPIKAIINNNAKVQITTGGY